jgi:hypothetical protein
MGGFKNRACIFPLYPNHTTYNIYIHIYIYYVNHIPDKPDKSIVTCRGPQMPNIFSRMVETSWDDGSSIISRFPSCRHLFGGCYTYIFPLSGHAELERGENPLQFTIYLWLYIHCIHSIHCTLDFFLASQFVLNLWMFISHWLVDQAEGSSFRIRQLMW